MRASALPAESRRPRGPLAPDGYPLKPALAVLIILVLVGSALLLLAQKPLDPLADYRTPDGGLRIPGGALTPELQRLIFGGNDLQPTLNLSRYVPARTPYPTADFVLRPYFVPNPNVFTRPTRPLEPLAAGVAHLVSSWFPPVDWGAQVRAAATWFFGLFSWDARADVAVASTTVGIDGSAATVCSTTQTTPVGVNGVIVILSEAGNTAYASVTYGSATLTLIPGTTQSNGIAAHIEIWGFSGAVPTGSQTMTATLAGGAKSKQTCGTILLTGVSPTGSFINGASATGSTADPTITLGATVTLGNLGLAGLALAAGAGPTTVNGTGAPATALYGVSPQACSSGNSICGAGASIPNPGTAVDWPLLAPNPWAVASVEVVQAACGSGAANCYRIGAGGAWSNPANWSNFSGGATCNCTPSVTDFAVFNSTPTGTTTLAAATTVAGIDMTGFTGTLDTSNPNNWALTVNGNFTIQGTFLPRGSLVTVTGNVVVLGATTVVTLNTSVWTVSGTWTNNSTAATWSAGTSNVTIKDAVSGSLTFANLSGATNEFNNLTLDTTAAAGITYTMATNGLRVGATLLIQNSVAGATGATILDTSTGNLSVTASALNVASFGAFNTEASAIAINGNANVSASSAYVTNTGGTWTVTGTWSDSSTSASWSFNAGMTFLGSGGRTMTFGPQAGNEFSGGVTFDTTAVAGVTYTLAGANPLDVGGLMTIRNSVAGATGAAVLDTSAASLAVNAGGLAQGTLGAFNTRASAVTVSGDVNLNAGSAYITNAGGSFVVSGAWTNRTTSAQWSFSAAITFRAASSKTMTFTGSNLAGNEFAGAVTFDTAAVAGVTYTMATGGTGDASLKIAGALTIRNTAAGATAATILDTSVSNYNVTAGSLTLGTPRGALSSEGSTITINGAVSVADATSYLVLGAATWLVTGPWTNGSTNSANWAAGTGTVTFRNSASATMTFGNLGANEFNNVTFDTSNAVGITYTMATNGLLAAGTLQVQNTAGTPTGNVVLTTGAANLPVAVAGLVLGARGTLTANGSTITVNGSWTSTAANHVWSPGTSTVVFGANGTLAMSAGESFANLTQSAGTTTLGSGVTVSGTTVVNGALDTSASNFTLTLQGALSIGAAGTLNLQASTATTAGSVTISSGGAVRFAGSGTWTINGSWTDNNASVPATWAIASSTVRFIGGGATTLTFWTAAGNEFNILVLGSSVAAGFTFTQVNPLHAAGTLTVQNTAAGATGAVLLDASALNYGLSTGGLNLGSLGGYAARGAAATVNGNVTVAASGYATSGATGAWTVTGSWTDASTSGSWSFLAPITFLSAAGQTMTFKPSGTEFGGAVTFDTTNTAGITYTMGSNGLALSGLLTIRNTAAGATGNTILDTSASSRPITAGSVLLGTNGTLRANGSTLSIGGNWTATAANATFVAGTSTVVFTANATINMLQAFNNVTVSAGTSTLAANTTIGASLTVSGGLLAKGTFTLSTSSLTLSGGGLTSTSGAAVVTGSVAISAAASYIAFGSETWTIGGSWTDASTSASWSSGTGTVVFSATSPTTMTFAGAGLGGAEFNSVTFDTTSAAGVAYTMATRGLRIAGALLIRNSTASPTGNVELNTSAAGLAISAGSVALGASGTLTANGSPITLSGSWTSSAVGAVFNSNSSTVTFTAVATVTLGATQSFNVLTITAGTVTQGSQLTANAVTVSSGSLAKGANSLTVNGALTLSGGSLTSTSGNVVVAGSVAISSAASYLVFGSETWTVAGTWTNASTSASWNAGTGTVTFTPAASGTFTFGNLGANEFNNLTFSPTTAVVVTMAANGLRWGGTLALNANATLATGGLALTGGAMSVGNAATLASNASAVSVTDVTMTGGTSGTITLTTGMWSVSGNWDSSGTGSTFTSGTSSVVLSGASKTVKLLAGQQFATLTVSGTIGQASDLRASSLSVTGTLTKTGFNLVLNGLTASSGTIADGTVSVSGFTVSDNDPTAYITFSVFSTWTANTQYAWTHTDSKATDTITFTIGGQTGVVYNVTKDGALFTSGSIVGGNITFTMLGSDPSVVVNASGCGGNSRYWVQGTGTWSQTSHWASTSGGVGGCSLPGNPTAVFLDANSGTGTVTVDMNTSFATLNTTGSTISIIALGTNSLTTSGNVTHASGVVTLGASAGTGLTVGGSLTLSGTAAIDGSGAASVLNVAGGVTISTAAAYLRMGSGTWTVSGAWTNGSTSASWSPGTGTVLFNAGASQSMTFAGTGLPGAEFYNVMFNSGAATATFTLATRGILVANLLTIQGGTGVTTLDLSAGNLPLTTVGVTIGAGGVLNGRGSTITVSGSWDSHLGTFTAGTSSVLLTGVAGTVNTASAFASLTVSGAYTLASALTAGPTVVSGSLSTSGSSFGLTAGDLTVTGTLVGNASSLLVTGNWDSHLGTFSSGSSTVTLSGTSKTLNTASPFASLHVTGSVTLASAVTAGTALNVDTNGTLDTSSSSYAVNAASLTVGATGTLVGESSTITATSMDTHLGVFTTGSSTVVVGASSGTINVPQTLSSFAVPASVTTSLASGLSWSGSLTLGTGVVVTVAGNLVSSGAGATLTLNSASLTVAGSWDTSSTSGSFGAGTSVVTLSGTSTSVKLAGGQIFNVVTVSGTVTLSSDMRAMSLVVTGTLTKTGFALIFNALTDAAGTIVDGTVNASNFTVANSESTAFTTTSLVSVWTPNVQYGWTHTSSSATTTITFTIGSVTASVFNVTKNGVLFTSGPVVAGQVQFTMLGSDPDVLVNLSGCTGTDVYWVLGTGNWNDTAHWASSSGGVAGCSAPLSNSNVHLDANSGSGTITVNVDVSIASLNTTGSTIGTLAIGTHGFSTSGNVIHAAGILAVGASAGAGLVVGGSLTLSGSAILDGSGAASVVSVVGNASITTAAAYVRMGTATWTFHGGWSNGSTAAAWSPGTATVVFDSPTSQSMAFASLPGGAPEFYNVVFDSGGSTVTFTMTANALVWSGTLAVQGAAGTTTLATAGLALVGGALSVGNAGTLTAGTSTVTLSDVTMTGGTSGTITITTGSWTTTGNWDTSGTGSTLSAGTSTLTLTGSGTTLNLGAGQSLSSLAVTGSVSLASTLTVAVTVTVETGATLIKTGQSIAFNGLTENGTGRIADGTVSVVGLTVTDTNPANLTTVSVFSVWVPNGHFRWTNAAVATSVTFTIAGNVAGNRFDVTNDGTLYYSGFIDVSGQAVVPMPGSSGVIDVIVAAPCAGVRYWVGGAGNWSDQAHWSATSGGAGGCNAPNGPSAVYFDANSGGGVATVDQNATMASLDTTGWTGTLAIGSYNFAVGGNLAHVSGILSIGASSGTGLTVAGNLNLSGTAVLDGSGAPSAVTVNGNVTIASTTAYLRMGSGTWTFAGSWSNASTSANWAAGTGTVVFTSLTSATMSFGGFAQTEFNSVTFASAASGAVTYTMAVNSLRWSGTLTVQDAAGSTTLATADLPLAGGSLVVGNSGTLRANASTVAVASVQMTSGASGTITVTSGSWTVSGDWDSSGAGSQFAKGTSSVTLSGAGHTVKILDTSNGFYNLAVTGSLTQSGAIDVSGTLSIRGALTTAGNAITGSPSLVISGGGSLFGMSATLALSSVTMNDAGANTLSLTSGSLSVSGSWDTSGPASVLVAGTSTVTLTAASGSIALGAAQTLATLVLSGTYTLGSQLSVSSLTLPSGGLAKGAHPLTVQGDLILSGGSIASVSGDVSVGGNVDITAAGSFIGFGSETWTLGGAWTSASTSSSWSAGTGTVVFAAASSQTMTFAGTSLPSLEFYSVVFLGGSSATTFALAGSALRAQTITVGTGAGSTTVDTTGSGLPITADTLTVAAGGHLSVGGSVLTIRSMDTASGDLNAGASTVVVSPSGGTVRVPQTLHNLTVPAGIATTFASNITWSATLTLTGATVAFQGSLTAAAGAILTFAGATISLAGSWDTSSAATFVPDGSTVSLIGSGGAINLGTGQAFATLVITGSAVLASDLVAESLTVSTGGTLTKTNRVITFNSLTLDGTAADGSVNATGLTVTNDDGAARVTISVFTAWSAGREYAWTHASSLATQTSTWTIRGNTAGFLYHVTKDGASFADGTVAGSGDIVLRMLGSDPNIWVGVAVPPVLPWWQSIYFLGVLPLPFLMVVAMFAQRRRWRPTKAFLVDERGQLLREFSLDPSCEVTYDQAREAGALGAVEKDVRVARYNARAVRGDMLSLIVLAVGPADVQETEFARGLLQGIQDRLEDSARARVAEARGAEESLKSAREASYEERADLQARARVFGEMVNAFTIARTKLDSDSQKQRKQDANLRQREESLAEVRTSLEEQTARASEREAEMERTATALKAKEQALVETDEALRERERVIDPREKEVEQRAREVTDAESDLAGRETLLTQAQAQLTADLDEHHRNTEQAAALQAELAEERKALDDLSLQLDEQTKDLEAKTASAETREKEAAEKSEELRSRLAELEPREQAVAVREAELGSKEKAQVKKDELLASREDKLRVEQDGLKERESALATRIQDLAGERNALDELTNETVRERKALDAKADDLVQRETEIATKVQDIDHLKANLGPREAAVFQKESDLSARERALANERKDLQAQQDSVAAKALEATQQMEQIKEQATALAQERLIIRDAKAAFESQERELEASRERFANEVERRQAELGAQENTLGEARLRLTKDAETFEAQRLEKGQWIASKEIELEAKEQSLLDREKEIRAQAEDNARRLSDLAAREETLEIEGDKIEKARAEVETRKAETGALARDLETRMAHFRREEADKAEELRTWQTTLESEQALLKEQREASEKEMQELRESWAGRMIRVEQREEELREREAKVQADVEWVAKSESELSSRERAASESVKATAELRTQNERVRQELEQRAMEVESRERGLHEEAAEQSVTLEKRTEALQAREAELGAQRAQWERELSNQVQKMKDREAEVQARKDALDAQETDLAKREDNTVNQQAALQQHEERLAREKADALRLQRQLEAGQLELAQARERLEAESVRLTTEADAVRESLAAKDADLTSERERLERESSALQDKLGAKAKEMAAREKAVTAREAELSAEEQDLDARMREIESRERQAEAHLTELNARADALARGEADLKSRHGAFDNSVRAFQSESTVRQKEWSDLQNTLKSQEAQLAASTETRQAEIRKRMEELEQRERSLSASQTQAQIERQRLEAQAKAHAAKQTELDAAAGRADKRFAELKAMEAENLRVRQEIEVERAAWSNRRTEELRQLEATRDAAAEQTQQAERLIEDSQRRAYVAAEAEKSSKRQAEELAAAQTVQERRRADAEKAEKDLEAQMAQLREASQRLASKELELTSRVKNLDALQARLAAAEKKSAETAESLKARKTSLDQEVERAASLAATADQKGAEVESRRAAVEAKLAEATKREQILSTELQRADNLMDDLNRKEAELQTRDKGLAGRAAELATKEEALAQRDAELKEGLQTLERLRREQEAGATQLEHDYRAAEDARKEAETVRGEAQKLKAQADAMQAEVAKNMRFLQKKALDVLDREEKIRTREVKVDEQGHLLESRAQILEQKDRVFDTEKSDLTERLEKMRQENEKLKVKLAEAQAAGKTTIDMDEWKRDIENRVKIIQKKALDLLDREEKLRKKEEELRALAAQLGVAPKP